nr:NAD(P)-dependent alcohol dehydrogenase [Saprospiraceae bacterium]
MKAALRRTYGSEEVIRIEDIPITPLKPGEILVKVHATTVNRTDIGVLTGRPLIFRLFIGLRPKRKILGTDFAGIVAKTAGDVSEFAEGDAVFGFHDEGLQSQAEYVVMNEKGNIMPIPEGIDMATAAASLEGAHYALNFVNKVKLLPTDRILLNGATGAIGSAALQFLKANGHHVTAVANTKNMALIKSLGADKLYDYEKEDFTTDPDQYPFVFDAVGKSSFGKCKKLLTRRGVYISS